MLCADRSAHLQPQSLLDVCDLLDEHCLTENRFHLCVLEINRTVEPAGGQTHKLSSAVRIYSHLIFSIHNLKQTCLHDQRRSNPYPLPAMQNSRNAKADELHGKILWD